MSNQKNRSRSRTRQIPYIGNTVGTTSRQFLNDILMEDRRNHGGILHQMLRDDIRSAQPTTNQFPADPTRIVLKSTVTPFGILEKYTPPEPKHFQFDKTSGYYYDPETGFYYDAKTDYYYNKKTNQWMFWCTKFSTYINCEGGDIEQKRQLQDDERMYQFQQKQREFEQPREEKIRAERLRILDRDEEDIQMIGSSSSHQPNRPREEIVVSNNAGNSPQNMLREHLHNCLRQNQEFMGVLQKELSQAKDRHKAEQIKSEMHDLLKQFEKIQNSLASLSSTSAFGGQQSTSAQAAKPSLKRHITKESIAQQFVEPQRTGHSLSVIKLLDDEDNGGGWNRRKSRYDELREANRGAKTSRQVEPVWRPNADGPLTGRTAFDVHIEQAERLRVLKESLQKRQAQLGFESQVRQMEDRRIQDERPDRSAGTKRHSSSLERHHRSRARSRSRARGRDHSRPRRRHESPGRREASPRKSRYDRSESRHGREERRHRHHSRAAVGREPMAISPEPPAVVRMEMDEGRGRQQSISRMEKWAGNGGGMVQQQVPGMLQSGLPLMQSPNMRPIPPIASARGFSSSLGGGFSSPQMGMLAPGKIPPQFGGSAGPQIPAMLAPMGSAVPAPPNAVISSIPGMPPMFTANQIFGSNDDHWRMVANQQQEHILPGALSSKNAAAAAGRMPQLGSSQQRTPVATGGGQQLVCSFCGFAGHVRVDCPTADRMGKQKEDLTEKERARVQKLNLCLNCGRIGHTQFGCQNPRIPDEQLQRKIRRAEERHKLQELEKQKLKKKAEKYPVRRKDPFIQRLREVAPSGKITKECVRLLCTRCAHLNHQSYECARPVAGRSLYKQIGQAMEEFTKIFFVHLNDENLVDFSQKFELFTVMDGIEKCGTLDPVGLQLQIICRDGIVTQGDLRELCSNCANLGHKQQDCHEKEACTRSYYEKMLSLVKAYRALVKEGNGNFLLPTAYQRQKPTQNATEKIAAKDEEALLNTSSETEAANGNTTKDDKMEADKAKQGSAKSTTGSMSTTSAEEGRLAIVEEQDTSGSAGHNTSSFGNGNGAADAGEDDDIMVL